MQKNAVAPVLKPSKVILENRKSIQVDGVIEVISAGDSSVISKTEQGVIIISGTGLRTKSLSMEEKVLIVEGSIDGIKYSGSAGKSLFKRIFK